MSQSVDCLRFGLDGRSGTGNDAESARMLLGFANNTERFGRIA